MLVVGSLLAFLTWSAIRGGGGDNDIAINALPSRVSAGAELHALSYLRCDPSGLPASRSVESALNIILASSEPSATPEGDGELAVVEGEEVTQGIGCNAYDVTSIAFRRWRPAARTGLQQHTFLASTRDGVALQVDVLVSSDVAGLTPILAAVPSVQPINPDTEEVELTGLNIGDIPGDFNQSAASDRLQEWANAYLTGDQEAMLNVTDQRTSQVILGNSRSELQSVLEATPLGRDFETTTVRVRYVFADTSGRGHSFDVFIDRIDEPLPVIAGWGPPGSNASTILNQFN